jgi:hypothetical protein
MARTGFVSCLAALFALAAFPNGIGASSTVRPSTPGLGTASATCTPTVPNGNRPPGEDPSPVWHGDGKLWTQLVPTYDDPRWIQLDGSIGIKFPWWRAVRGRLVITGKRIDGAAPRLVADVPAAYGTTGFQASRIFFPTRGCWSVTGAVASEKLQFVVDVTTGRNRAPVPRAVLLRPRVRRTRAEIRWRVNDAAWTSDLRVRRNHGQWRTVLWASHALRYVFHRRMRERLEVEVRATDRFGPGPWSRPRVLRLG